MRRVIVESPYKGEGQDAVERNLRYLRLCLRDCFRRGEAPYASHGLYTQPGVLDDSSDQERQQGIDAGMVWKDVAHATVVYTDLGITRGMSYGIEHAEKLGMTIEMRRLGESWDIGLGRHTWFTTTPTSTTWSAFKPS